MPLDKVYKIFFALIRVGIEIEFFPDRKLFFHKTKQFFFCF